MPLIMGIDPGLNKTGWGLVNKDGTRISFVSSGLIKTNDKEQIYVRLKTISDELNKVILSYKPDEASIEETFVNKNAISSLKLGFVRGAIMLTLVNAGIKITEYPTNLIKKTVTSSGFADKEQIQRMVKILLPGANVESEDESDALAAAICHINHN